MLNLLLEILKDERGVALSVTRPTSNTLITASGFASRYTEIEAVVNTLDGDNIEDDAIDKEHVAVGVVRANYGLAQHTTGALQVDPSDTNPALEITDGGLRVKVDGTTITRTSSGLVASGVSDHGALTGLTDDDHSIYLNTARHDLVARHAITVGGTGQVTAGAAFAALAAGKLYDSGWFAVTNGGTYPKTHGLGTNKFIATVFFSAFTDGSNAELCMMNGVGDTDDGQGIMLEQITQTTLVAQAGAGAVHRSWDSSGNLSTVSSGWARIVLLALA